jgi:hypothetical protein
MSQILVFDLLEISISDYQRTLAFAFGEFGIILLMELKPDLSQSG